ncbi:MAG: aminoacyl-tRNA hydrolase [Flavobacteriaceae bacterium]
MKKFLIVGLGNIGFDYKNTRHNIGFEVIDYLAKKHETDMEEVKLCKKGTFRYKGKKIILLKPSTFMNRSGKAVRYWALKENVAIQNILVITDDLNLPLAKLRLKGKGSDGGHNGLKDIEAQLNTPNYPRLRFGIKNEEKSFNQIDFVLGKFSAEENNQVIRGIIKCEEIALSFTQMGLEKSMNLFNVKTS